jgi:hypothetical protein
MFPCRRWIITAAALKPMAHAAANENNASHMLASLFAGPRRFEPAEPLTTPAAIRCSRSEWPPSAAKSYDYAVEWPVSASAGN